MVKRAGGGQEHGEVVVKKHGGKHQHDEHGGAWKVAFADFCLALMCLFLVLWVLAARDKEDLEMAMAGGGAANMSMQGMGDRMIGEYVPGAMIPREPVRKYEVRQDSGGQSDAKKLLETPEDMKELSRKVEAAGQQVGLGEHISTVVTAQGLRIMVHDTDQAGMFRVGSAEPTLRFAQLLRSIGPMFKEIDNQLVIAGHTDARPYLGTSPFGASNWSLSLSRALAARAHMLSGGMPERSVLQVIGMADAAPVDPQQPLAAVNRRVELLVTTKPHAASVRTTFGPLPEREKLTPELESSKADTPVLETLRRALVGSGAGSVTAVPATTR